MIKKQIKKQPRPKKAPPFNSKMLLEAVTNLIEYTKHKR